MSFEDLPDAMTFAVMEVLGRAILTDTRTGQSWILSGMDEGRPYWHRIDMPREEKKK